MPLIRILKDEILVGLSDLVSNAKIVERPNNIFTLHGSMLDASPPWYISYPIILILLVII